MANAANESNKAIFCLPATNAHTQTALNCNKENVTPAPTPTPTPTTTIKRKIIKIKKAMTKIVGNLFCGKSK